MSSRSSTPVELDFFRMERESLTPGPKKNTRRLTSFRDIQREVSKLNPEVIKAVFASADADRNYTAFGNTAEFSYSGLGAKHMAGAPMTIFYNGTVSVFDVPQHHAENILQLAQHGISKMCMDPKPSSYPIDLLERFTNMYHLPFALQRSLKHFLEKRKERLKMVSSPYGCPFPKQYANKYSPCSATSLSLSLFSDHQLQNTMPM